MTMGIQFGIGYCARCGKWWEAGQMEHKVTICDGCAKSLRGEGCAIPLSSPVRDLPGICPGLPGTCNERASAGLKSTVEALRADAELGALVRRSGVGFHRMIDGEWLVVAEDELAAEIASAE